MKFISRLYTRLSVVSWWSSAGPGGGVGAALNSVFHLLANRMDLQRRNRLTHWLPSGQPHAGPFTAGSADTTLWSSLRKRRWDNKFNTRLQGDDSYTHTAAAAHRDQESELCHLGQAVHCARYISWTEPWLQSGDSLWLCCGFFYTGTVRKLRSGTTLLTEMRPTTSAYNVCWAHLSDYLCRYIKRQLLTGILWFTLWAPVALVRWSALQTKTAACAVSTDPARPQHTDTSQWAFLYVRHASL